MNKTNLDSLKEMRNACAACFRVIARHELAEELETELILANVKEGFGLRFQNAIKAIENKTAGIKLDSPNRSIPRLYRQGRGKSSKSGVIENNL